MHEVISSHHNTSEPPVTAGGQDLRRSDTRNYNKSQAPNPPSHSLKQSRVKKKMSKSIHKHPVDHNTDYVVPSVNEPSSDVTEVHPIIEVKDIIRTIRESTKNSKVSKSLIGGAIPEKGSHKSSRMSSLFHGHHSSKITDK
jgi:hypothetical protein